MKRLLPLLSLAPMLLVTMGAGPCDSQPLGNVDGGTTCTYQGKTYVPGSSVPSNDNCNSCSCGTNGEIACTLKACICAGKDGKSVPCAPTDGAVTDVRVTEVGAPDVGASDGGADMQKLCFDNAGNIVPCLTTDGGATTCDYLGKAYPAGTSFPSSDGCNTCSCGTAGVDCTYKACSPDAGFRDAGLGDGGVITGVCKVGFDQTCNEDPVASALRGKCEADGSCVCAGSGTSGAVSPYTGKCLGPKNTTGDGCEYGGEVRLVGTTFTCADGCNTCTCKAPGTIVTTEVACGDGGTTPICGLDAIYIYGSIGGKVAYQDQVTIAPSTTSPTTTATYVLTRSSNGGASGVSCSPSFPTCGSPTELDVSDIMADILDPVVQKFLSTKGATALLFGLDTRPVDGPIFSFQRGGGFLVGAPCNGATSCTDIPSAIAKLVADLRALDQQQLQSPACATVVAPPKP